MLRLRLALVLLVAASGWSLTSCVDLADRLCRGDETYVEREGGGLTCAPRRESDPECPDGERARRIEATGRTDCVVDEA